MIILEGPYVSEFLQQTVADLQVPVADTEFSRSLPLSNRMNLVSPEPFFRAIAQAESPLLYSNSENSTGLLNRYLPGHPVTERVNYFKDKARLREIFSRLNPTMWHRRFSLKELERLDPSDLPKPFVVKPVRGFASIGIHAVHSDDEWPAARAAILKEAALMEGVFPDSVVSLGEFMAERYIAGDEIAIDAYFDGQGEPVILNILHHLFASESDMSDRLYLTSGRIIRRYYAPVENYLREIAGLRDLRNFPFHMEMRIEPDGTFVPIEINPMRFMGFCVADVEYYFYGINPYEYYFHQKRPDWDAILASREGRIYGMFGIDIPKHLDKNLIRFDYDRFIGHFSRPIHYVKMDYRRLPMAIYLFAETTEDRFWEFETILRSDLSEFIGMP